VKDSYRIAAMQMEIRNRKYPHDLLNDMKKLILEAFSKNVDIIVFPDYMDLNLLPYYITSPDYNLTDSGFSLRKSLLKIFKSRNFFVKELIFTELINIARKYNIFICSGGWLEIKNNRFKKSIALISPSDGIIIERESTHLFPWEYELNFIQGESLLFRKDVLGSVGILVGGEIYFPEVSRILSLLGTRILLASSIYGSFFIPPSKSGLKNKYQQEKDKFKHSFKKTESNHSQGNNIFKYSNNASKFLTSTPYNDFKYRGGIWRDVQQNQVFACESFLLGNLGNDKLEGRASIVGPCEITNDESGIIAQAGSFDKEEIVIGEVKLSELEKIRKKYPIKKFLNPNLYKKYLPNIYEKMG
jgi:predicted amidohydrolase